MACSPASTGSAAGNGTEIRALHALHRTFLPRAVSGTDSTARHLRFGQIMRMAFTMAPEDPELDPLALVIEPPPAIL
ncbi:MAG: hypothetical protein RLN76_12415 [Phycisphaeraceae bacterium]